MIHSLHYLWSAMWPNIFAPSIFTLFGIGIAHVKAAAKRKELEHHIKLQRHFNKNDPFTLDDKPAD